MRRMRPADWWITTAAVSAVGLGLLITPPPTMAQMARPSMNASPGFARTVQHLMDQARKEAAAGNLEAALQTALRARKIAEAAGSSLGASPDCSPAAADKLYRELLDQRPVALPSRTPVTQMPSAPPPQAPIVAAPTRETKPADAALWRPKTAPVKTAAVDEADVSRSESPAAKPVVLKRSLVPDVPVATKLELMSSLSIVGGDRVRSESEPRQVIPLEDVAPTTTAADLPEWAQLPKPQTIPEVTTESPQVVTAVNETVVIPQPQRGERAEWSSIGAVAPRQRLARADSLRGDGWRSPSESSSAAVTPASGTMTERPEAMMAALAYRRGAVSSADAPAVKEPVVPPPPLELDEVDVSLRSPSVWIRETTPVLAPAAPPVEKPATSWRSFTQWTKHRGWSGTSAAAGLAAALLACLACVIAIIPRRSVRD
ncbi:MAG TPA: hypothetical protein VFG20_01435 [Planctomycetaceae bacterium]|nr:hypothetical protein [Planctomycetaceae bacterium]